MVGFSNTDDYEWSASNFEVIQGDVAVRVGDSPTVQNFKKNFFATGVGYGGAGNIELIPKDSFITLMVRHLQSEGVPEVILNNKKVGVISPYGDDLVDYYFMQTISVGRDWKFGKNRLEIKKIPLDNPRKGNVFDDFLVKNIIFHYSFYVVQDG